MNNTKFLLILCSTGLFSISNLTNAAVITFDDAITGSTSYSFDGDGDLVDDVIFTTTDPSGFNTAGPGTNMSYIDEPGLEGTTLLSPDLRVDFLNGAVDNLNFGFALNTSTGGTYGVSFSIFDSADSLLNSIFQVADFTTPDGTNSSSFPEAITSLNFTGVASYATFDFSFAPSRYIIDNFTGTFGSTEDITPTIPEPATLALMGLGLAGIGYKRKVKQ